MTRRPWYERDTMGGPGDAPPLVCVACKGDNNARLTPDGMCDACVEEQATIDEQEMADQIERDARHADLVMEQARNAYLGLHDAEVAS
jgi:hypothetical protein